MALVAATAADARDVMVEGESGILAVSPPWNRPHYEPSKRRLTWKNGAIATTYSADEPERFRGPQHDGAWCDELAAWRYPEAWDLLMFGLRLGKNPRCVVTTTPKPKRIVRELLKDKHVTVVRGTTYENRDNLAGAFYEQIVSKYEGTTLGQQELYGEILDELPGALWTRALIQHGPVPDLERIVVAIDPAVTSKAESDETGIIVAGRKGNKGYVLEDLSGRYSPQGWASKAVEAYHRWEADRIVAEVNQGGDMVQSTVRQVDENASYKAVHASKGKRVRAEPIAALYEQGRMLHAKAFTELEDQMCGWTHDMDWSPDRLDAMVWAFTELMLERRAQVMLV